MKSREILRFRLSLGTSTSSSDQAHPFSIAIVSRVAREVDNPLWRDFRESQEHVAHLESQDLASYGSRMREVEIESGFLGETSSCGQTSIRLVV